ncbi:hypothetical protein [Bradyrhizobium sp. CCGUVB23]|uniref:hypothetical protein n=1 Tax=Bradyrhizobium sp. CCGUVB23 TaxID=2949630 RepID=UPI0020B398C5|nr:hypothetical protein [Bradyrhizobium sp. CCGUVB23]MCP3463100.1 hypothetical protein [Bradyrhizobium sp. CCGUVB23]
MNELSVRELMKLARAELCGLANRLTLSLPARPEQSAERTRTLRYMHDIRRVLDWYDQAPK